MTEEEKQEIRKIIKGLEEGKLKLICKPDEWYDEGTEVECLSAFTEESWLGDGLFRGLKDGKIDEEMCGFDEFEVVSL